MHRCSILTPGEEDGLQLEAASVLQPGGQLAEVTAVQVQSDPQGLPAALHLVTHRRVCNAQIQAAPLAFGLFTQHRRMVRGCAASDPSRYRLQSEKERV